jgi:hypothetical protein
MPLTRMLARMTMSGRAFKFRGLARRQSACVLNHHARPCTVGPGLGWPQRLPITQGPGRAGRYRCPSSGRLAGRGFRGRTCTCPSLRGTGDQGYLVMLLGWPGRAGGGGEPKRGQDGPGWAGRQRCGRMEGWGVDWVGPAPDSESDAPPA